MPLTHAVHVPTPAGYLGDLSAEPYRAYVERKLSRELWPLLGPQARVIMLGLRDASTGRSAADASGLIVNRPLARRSGHALLDAAVAAVGGLAHALRHGRREPALYFVPNVVDGLPAALARRLARRRLGLVVRPQSHNSQIVLSRSSEPSVQAKAWLLERLERFVLRSADLVLPMSGYLRDWAIAAGVDPGRCIVLPYCGWEYPTLEASWERVRCRQVLYVGRLVAEKGVEYLVDAFATVRQRVPDARLRLVGDGQERSALEARVRERGLAGAVEFVGQVPRDRVWRAYQEAAVVVVPSVCPEGLGMVVVEAGLAHRPVVASSFGGLADVVRDGVSGYLVAPRDARALAERIVTLLESPALGRELGAAGHRLTRAYLGLSEQNLPAARAAIARLLGELGCA